MVKNNDEKILIIGPAWVGDMVMSQSLYRALKENYPGCQISVMAPSLVTPLLKYMPEVDEGLDLELKHGELKLRLRRQIGLSLKERGFTRAIVLPQSFKSALIPWHAGIKKRIGWRGEWRDPLLNDCRKPKKTHYPLMVQRFAALAYPSTNNGQPAEFLYPKLLVEPKNVTRTASAFEIQTGSNILAICPGAEFGEAKQWPADYFAELANLALDRDWQIVVFGSANDLPIAEAILAKIEDAPLDRVVNLAGKTSLGEAIELLSLASVVVSNDSGLMHVAAALGKPLAAIYGSTSPSFTPPLADKVKVFATDIECRPCFKRECPLGHLLCLKEIMPKEVNEAVNTLRSA